MNRSKLLARSFLLAAAFSGVTAVSQAATLTYQARHEGGPLDFLEEPWLGSGGDLSYGATWDITTVANGGYVPNSHPFLKIELWFAFADDRPGANPSLERTSGNDGDAEEHVRITAGTETVTADLEVDGKHPASTYEYYPFVFDSANNPAAFAALSADLMADGKLAYRVELLELLSDSGEKYKKREDTYFKVAKLRATYDEPERNVPEGGAGLAMFGLTLAGLVGWRRRKS
jgi:hypothetical protein